MTTLSQQIDAIAAEAIERRVFPGAVVLVSAGEHIQHFQAYGTTMYDHAGSQPVRHDTIYDVASLTKMFTATAALRLSDTGAIDLRAPAAEYLPHLRARSVTIWHLLTHTSGLDIRLSALRHAGRAGLLETVYQLQPAHPPGSTVAYTNVNSLLLGEIVARQHGAPLDRALHELVIGPLGLRDTQFSPSGELLARVAPTERDDTWRGRLVHGSVHDESAHALGGVAGHAGLFSTTMDIFQFCRAWARAAAGQREQAGLELLRPATARLAMSDQTPGLRLACGLGWMIDRPNFMGAAPPATVGHTGFTGPAMVIARAADTTVVVLSNRIYPQRGVSAHHPVTAAIVSAALCVRTDSGAV